ncbi:MAG: hypothetical protein JWR89_3749, partial [Tardiphaga sp.]|nr:hypothetical protein [Tardiphaga sp.]
AGRLAAIFAAGEGVGSGAGMSARHKASSFTWYDTPKYI